MFALALRNEMTAAAGAKLDCSSQKDTIIGDGALHAFRPLERTATAR
jgi:hypothetical protein